MPSSKKSLEDIVETNFKFYGEQRLRTFTTDELTSMLAIHETKHSDDQTTRKFESKDAMIEHIMRIKTNGNTKSSPLSQETAVKMIQQSARKQKKSERDAVVHTEHTGPCHELPDGEITKLIPSGEDGVALEVTVQNKPVSTRVIKERHSLRIVAFNSLKLRIGKTGLAEQWLGLVATLATFDIVVLSEVPAEQKQEEDGKPKRSDVFIWLLEHHSGDKWSVHESQPSGPGNLETHVIFVRDPVKVIAQATHFAANGTKLDHAPFAIHVIDERFEQDCNKNWVLTSVHFPPKSRSRERDTQLTAFLETYAAESAMRLQTPFSTKGAKDANKRSVHHVICGDFNCFPDDNKFHLETKGYAKPLLGEHISTSSGGSAYDNFIISQHTEASLTLDRQVLELEIMMQKSDEGGVSDHSPIAMVAREVALVKKK